MTELQTERVTALSTSATPEAATKLQELAETAEDKATRKAAKRALYQLSQKGIRPMPRETQAVVAVREPKTDAVRCFASAFDGAGNRLLFFLVPDADGGSPSLLQVLMSDSEGVRDLGWQRLSRKEVADYLAQFEQKIEEGLALAEIEVDYGRWIVAQAREINRRHHRMTPAGFLDWLPKIAEPRAEYPASPVYAHITAADVRADTWVPHDPADFFKLAWFEPWFLAVEDAFPWWVRVDSSGSEKIELPENVKREQREKVFVEAIQALLPPEIRADYVRRLEESADILRRRGEMTAAKQTLYQALELAEDKPVSDSAFARTLVERTMQAAAEMMRAYTSQKQ